MSITLDEVKKVIRLANLQLDDKEEQLYQQQLSAILDYVGLLKEQDTAAIPPTFNISPQKIQVEEVSELDANQTLSQSEAMQNTTTKDGYFSTKGIFEDE